MIPLPINPTIVLHISRNGDIIIRSANNIDPNVTVILVDNSYDFKKEAANQPFNSENPIHTVEASF